MKAHPLLGLVLVFASSAASALPPPPASAPKAANVAPAPAGAGTSAAPASAGASSSSGGGAPGLSPTDSCNQPMDITADGTEVFQPQRLVIYRGNVEAIHCEAHLRTPEMRIYYKPKNGQQGAAPAPQPAATPGTLGADTGGIDHIDAQGPVYYYTPTENARADHMLYEKDPDTITMTGNVVLVNGKNVGTGEKFVMDRKTGHDQLYASASTGRVRTILYTQQQQPNGQPAAKPAAKPAGH